MNLNLAPVELTGAFFGGRRLRSALLTFALHTLTGLIIDTFWNWYWVGKCVEDRHVGRSQRMQRASQAMFEACGRGERPRS